MPGMNVAVARVTESGLPLAYSTRSAARTNWSSTARRSCSTPTAALAAQLPAWREAIVLTEWNETDDGWRCERGEVAKLAEG